MTEIHGVTGAPYATPNVRKKLPSPFTRERIDLDGGTRVKRSWQDISVLRVKPGDTVAGFGTVADVGEYIKISDVTLLPSVWQVTLSNVMGDTKQYSGEQRVYVFAETPE